MNEELYQRQVEFYDQIYTSGTYALYAWHPEFERRAFRIASIPPFGAGNILECGCGRGYMIHILRTAGVEAYGLEISHKAIIDAHGNAKGYIVQGSLDNMHMFKNNQFDNVTFSDVIEHVPWPYTLKAVDEITRICSHYLYMTIPVAMSDATSRLREGDPNDPYDLREHPIEGTRAWWKKLFIDKGWNDRSKEEYDTFTKDIQSAHTRQSTFLFTR